MPPLLAAFLMLTLGCDLRIVQAIDLAQPWRRALGGEKVSGENALCWYQGILGQRFMPFLGKSIFYWPATWKSFKKYYSEQLN